MYVVDPRLTTRLGQQPHPLLQILDLVERPLPDPQINWSEEVLDPRLTMATSGPVLVIVGGGIAGVTCAQEVS